MTQSCRQRCMFRIPKITPLKQLKITYKYPRAMLSEIVLVFIDNFGQIHFIVLTYQLLTLNMSYFVGGMFVLTASSTYRYTIYNGHPKLIHFNFDLVGILFTLVASLPFPGILLFFLAGETNLLFPPFENK